MDHGHKDPSANFYIISTDQFKAVMDGIRQVSIAASLEVVQTFLDERPADQQPVHADDQRDTHAPGLDVVEFSKWRTWKERFVATAEINGWSHARARKELAVCITGEARDLISDITLVPTDGTINTSYLPVLDQIENLIISSSDLDGARDELASAQQEPNEDILKWRNRVRVLWMRAHPPKTVEDAEEDRMLIIRFLEGLKNKRTKVQTWNFLPRRLTEAAQRAQNIEAGALIFGTADGPSSSINAFHTGGSRVRKAFKAKRPTLRTNARYTNRRLQTKGQGGRKGAPGGRTT